MVNLNVQKPRCRLSEAAEMPQIRGGKGEVVLRYYELLPIPPIIGGTSYGFPAG
jgi:hypothetical protein